MLALGNASNGRDSAAPIVVVVFVGVGVVVEAWVMTPAIKMRKLNIVTKHKTLSPEASMMHEMRAYDLMVRFIHLYLPTPLPSNPFIFACYKALQLFCQLARRL